MGVREGADGIVLRGLRELANLVTYESVVEEVSFTDEDDDPGELPTAEAVCEEALYKGQDSPTDDTHHQAPEPADVYLPSLSIASEKIAPHMTEWKRPAPARR